MNADLPAPGPAARTRPLGLLTAVAAALVLAVAAGLAAGSAVYGSRPEPEPSGWSDVGYAISAVAAAIVVGGLVYVVGVIAGVRWAVAHGRRAATALAIVGVTVAVPVFGASAARSAERGGVVVLAWLAMAVLLVAAGALVGVVAGLVHPRAAARLGAAAAAGLVIVMAVDGVRADGVADGNRVGRYEATGAPLALVGGTELAVPADGWEIVSIDQGWSIDDVTVTFAVPAPDGTAREDRVRLVMARDPEPPRCGRQAGGDDACVRLGRRDDGAEIMGDPLTDDPLTDDGDGDAAVYDEVWVDVAGGRWSLRGTDVPQPVDGTAAVAILAALEPVDAAAFTAAT